MIGAREYANLFTTGQYGRFYFVSGSHARGKTFHIYLLPEGEEAIPNRGDNPPLNKDCVEIYGIIGGNPGWTEVYGWLHEGKWQLDFERMVAEIKRILEDKKETNKRVLKQKKKEENERIRNLLSDY